MWNTLIKLICERKENFLLFSVPLYWMNWLFHTTLILYSSILGDIFVLHIKLFRIFIVDSKKFIFLRLENLFLFDFYRYGAPFLSKNSCILSRFLFSNSEEIEMTGNLSNNANGKCWKCAHINMMDFSPHLLTDFSLRTLEMNFKKHLWNVIKGFRFE